MIVNRRIEEDNLEERRAELLGQDALLMQRISDNVTSGRYVSAAELRAMVEGFLDGQVQDLSHDGTITVALDSTTVARLQAFVIKDRDNRPGTTDFLAKVHRHVKVPGTFDSEIAHRNRRLEFFNLRHPLVRAAVDHFGSVEHSAQPVVDLRLPVPDDVIDIPDGRYEFGIFLVAVDAAQRTTRLLPIVFGPDGRRAPMVESRLLRLVQDDGAASTDAVWTASDRDSLWARASTAASGEVDQIAAEAQERNDVTMAVRCATLERTYRARIARRRELLSKATNELIIRMRSGEIANLEADLARRLAEVRKHAVVSATFHPVASGRIHLTDDASASDDDPGSAGSSQVDRPEAVLPPDDEPVAPYVEPPMESW